MIDFSDYDDDDAVAYVAAVEGLDPLAWQHYGKSAFMCTEDELTAVALWAQATVVELRAEIARINAAVDQARAAVAEAQVCGCSLSVPTDEDDEHDIARVRVVHTCGAEVVE